MATAGEGTWPVVSLLVTLLTAMHSLPQYSDPDDVNLTPHDGFLNQPCMRETKKGLCLKEIQCLPNHTIAIGGDILFNEIRDGGSRLKSCGNLWCCTYPEEEWKRKPTPKPAVSPTPSSQDGSCSRVFNKCPWCVTLYREGGDEFRDQRSRSGLYCVGALIGSRVVLTATTCVRTVQEETVHARLLNGNQPNKVYTVVNNISHPNYSSGTHVNDFALMVLNEDVQEKAGSGACIDFSAPEGECQIVGFSPNEDIVMNPVSVRDGLCNGKRGGGSGTEVACATVKVKDKCESSTGAPLLCPIKGGQGGMAIAGIARLHCMNGKVLLGKVQSHNVWLTAELKKLGVEPLIYSP